MKKPLKVPSRRPSKWEVGDIAIEYITLRRDDDPMPPCILLLVVAVDGDQVQLESLDSNNPMTRRGSRLMGVAEALDYYDTCAEEMTVKSARIGRRKLEALATPFAPFAEWMKSLEWWEKYPQDRPEGWPVIREILLHNVQAEPSAAPKD